MRHLLTSFDSAIALYGRRYLLTRAMGPDLLMMRLPRLPKPRFRSVRVSLLILLLADNDQGHVGV